MTDTEKRLRRIIVEALRLNCTLEDIVGQNLTEELGITSVDALEILIRTEIEFGIRIEDEDLSADLIKSIESLESYVDTKRDHE